MSGTDIRIEPRGGITVVVFGEEYETLNEPLLHATSAALLELAARVEPPLVLLDMAQTQFIGSPFLALVFRFWRRLTTRGGRMVMCSPQDVVSDVLRVTQVDKLWSIHATRDAGLKALQDS